MPRRLRGTGNTETVKEMKDSSINALLVLSVALLVPGTAIISPEGRLFFLVLAGICAAPAALCGRAKGRRTAAVLIFIAVLVLCVSTFSEHRTSYDNYRNAAGRNR